MLTWFSSQPVLLEAGGQGGFGQTLLLLSPLFLIFYFMVIRPQSKQNKLRQEMLSNLKKNDRILTNGGIYGTVAAVQDDVITLIIDESQKVRIKVARNAIGGVVTDEDESAQKKK